MVNQYIMPLLLLIGLVFWGWKIELFALGILLAFLLLITLLIQRKYTFEVSAFYHIANLCALIIAAIFAYLWLDDRASKAIFPTLRLLPLALMPMLIMQYLHTSQKVPANVLMFFKRDKTKMKHWLDISALFLVICLFSAGAIVQAGLSYIMGVSLLLVALLLAQYHQVNIKRKLLTLLAFFIAVGLGLGIQFGLNDLQQRLEVSISEWIMNQHHSGRAGSAIGEVGRLKLSDEIVFRVQAKEVVLPMLLQQGTYQLYNHGDWFGGAWTDTNVSLQDNQWVLNPDEQTTVIGSLKHLRFYQGFERDKVVLALPNHVKTIEGLPVESVKVGQGHSIEVQGTPPFVVFDVSYDDEQPLSFASQKSDLHITKNERAVIQALAQQLNLYQIKLEQGPKEVLNTVNRYFRQKFTYSMWLKNIDTEQTALASFLNISKSGHCEYFATATVLILRELGIPARYAVGYVMSEWDKDAELFIVRGRDAHAWAIAEVDGEWVTVDNTPPDWFEIENQGQGAWQSLSDIFSNITFHFQKWRYTDNQDYTPMWLGLLSVLFSFLAFRVLRRVRTVESKNDVSTVKEDIDSDWLLLEQGLISMGYPRQQGETLNKWFERVGEPDLLLLIPRYYAKRFSSTGLRAEENIEFKQSIQMVRALFQKDRNN